MLLNEVCGGCWTDLQLDSFGAIIKPKKHITAFVNDKNLDILGSFLVLGDLHLGIDNYFEKKGLDAFVRNSIETCEFILHNLNRMIKKHNIEYVIINGDFIDEFSLSLKTRMEVNNLLVSISKICKLIIVKGNHDVMLQTLNFPKNVILCDFVLFDDLFICHGDKRMDDLVTDKTLIDRIKRIILSHEHPTIIVSDGIRKEKVKSHVLFCKHPIGIDKKVSVLLLPSSNPDIEGSDVINGFMSPILKGFNEKNSHLFIVENEQLLYFGTYEDYKLQSVYHY